jgi:hypothetical protein
MVLVAMTAGRDVESVTDNVTGTGADAPVPTPHPYVWLMIGLLVVCCAVPSPKVHL